jgi:hypothetical protein
VASIAWELFPNRVFVTLTYPADWPSNGRQVNADLKAYRQWLERRFGPLVVVWKREYQRRGAPHFHLLIALPDGAPLVPFRKATAEAWTRIVGAAGVEREKHRRAGTQVDVASSDCAGYFAYSSKSTGSKAYQDRVPEGYEGAGRVWGIWRYRPEWAGREVGAVEYVELRRRFRRWAKSATGFEGRGGRMVGEWYHTPGRSARGVLADLSRGLTRSNPGP